MKYRLLAGSYGRFEKGKDGDQVHVVYKKGDELELTVKAAKLLGDRVERVSDKTSKEE